MNFVVKRFKSVVILLAVSLFCISCSQVASISEPSWKILSLPTDATFADIAFTNNRNHGWLVGNHETLLETRDGGDTWQEKPLALGDEKASFTAVSFKGKEGWIVGKPAILLHTEDGGATWSRIPLSAKLPGAPDSIVALDLSQLKW